MIDPNLDVNEVCAIILAGKKNGCVILGGGSPKNFYLQGQPTLWEVYGIPKGGNDFFIQITTDQVVWGGLSGATPSEAVSWGKVNPGVLPDTVVAYCRFHDRVSVVLRVRRGRQMVHAQAQGAVPQARRAAGRPRRSRARPRSRSARSGPEGLSGRGDNCLTMGTLASELRPIAEELAGAPRVYVDANMPAGVVSSMRRELGWDVLFVMEHDDLRRAADAEHYQRALEFGRTLFTLDRDFLDDKRFPLADSPGVVDSVRAGRSRAHPLATAASIANVMRAPIAGRCRSAGRKVGLAPEVA